MRNGDFAAGKDAIELAQNVCRIDELVDPIPVKPGLSQIVAI